MLIISRSGIQLAWIGGKKIGGKWQWQNSGENINTVQNTNENGFERWMGGEPNNQGGNEDCLVTYDQHPSWLTGHLWFDVPCSNEYKFVCQENIGRLRRKLLYLNATRLY